MIENPVLIKEIKTKMRARQSPRVQTAAAIVMGLFILYCYYEAITYLVKYGGTNAGRDGWMAAFVLQTILIWLLCPALTANAISQEKEQQTWESLVFTLLTPREIILGKLAARLLPIIALLGAFFPFMLFCFMRSDLTPGDFFGVYGTMAVWVLFLATAGLFMSWAFRKTAAALASAYMVVFALVIGTALINATIAIGAQNWPESVIWWLNPVRIATALVSLRTDEYAARVVVVSDLTFAGTALFLIWRMLARFRTFSVDS